MQTRTKIPFLSVLRKKKFSFSFIPVLLLWALGWGNSFSANNSSSSPEFKELDRWYEVFLNGSKIGRAHSTVKLIENEVVSESSFSMAIKRAGISVEMKARERTRESLAGEIKSFSGEINMAGVPIIKRGWIEGNEIVVKEKQFFTETEKRYPFDPEGRMTWGLMKLLREKGFQEPGNVFETKMYAADFGMASTTRAKIMSLGEKTITIKGEERKVYQNEITLLTEMGEMKTVNWLDQDGFAVKTQMQMGGIPIEIKQCSESDAKTSGDPEDFLFQTLLFLDREIPPNATSVRFNVQVLHGEMTPKLFSNRNQKIEWINRKNLIVDVRAEPWSANSLRKESHQKVDPEYRESNLMIDSKDKLIRQLAKNAGQGSKNIIDLSENLFRFTHQYIRHKNFSVGFGTAGETARSREGDCTEHAVFLAALGRVLGIPTRVATGLVFMREFENKKNIMGFHMWTEFHLNGKWRTLDSALKKIGSHADRITFSVSSLNQDSLLEIGFSLAEMIGNIKVEIEWIKSSQ